MSRQEPSARPLDYEPQRKEGRRNSLVLALTAIGLFGAIVAMAFIWGMQSTTGVITVTSLAPAPPQSSLVPPEGVQIGLQQRESQWFAGERLKLSIGDITGGQVRVEISDDAGNVLLASSSVREGEAIEFADPDGAPLRLEVLKLTNNLVGEDFGEFRIAPAAPATRPALSEAQKIELLLSRIGELEGATFIRNGDEHSAQDAVAHLRMKWEQAGGPDDPQATAEDFIAKVASKSSLSGREYRIRLPDGRELPSGQWLREQLRQIEGAAGPATRASTTRPGDARSDSGEPDLPHFIFHAEPVEGVTFDDQPMNLPLPTLGGKQLWTDLRIDPAGWRIQRHALTGHCRLLDPRNTRRAWGSQADCEAAWTKSGPPHAHPATRTGRELVVVLHGLGRTRSAMRPMADHFRAAGYDVIDFGYASTRCGIDEPAAALAGVLKELGGYDRVHFVGHSLGALVVRRYLAMPASEIAPPTGRVVMLAPPNQGSALAARLKRNPVYLLAIGPIGQEIAEWKRLEKSLATPRDFAVIAGDCKSFSNPLLDDAADLVVTVEETKLDGMSDFLCVDVTHTFLMRNPQVIRQTLSFLRGGRFEGE